MALMIARTDTLFIFTIILETLQNTKSDQAFLGEKLPTSIYKFSFEYVICLHIEW